MWREITAAFHFDDPASTAILRVGLEALQRMRECREAITRDGPSVKDRWGAPRAHLLVSCETDA